VLLCQPSSKTIFSKTIAQAVNIDVSRTSFGSAINGSLAVPAVWLALWNSLVQVGVMLGSAITGPIADIFGRKLAFLIGGIIGCVGVAVLYTSDMSDSLNNRRGAFLAGKIVLGVSLGILTSACQTYISEIAPARLRGPLLSMYTLFTVLGQLIGISIIFSRISIEGPEAYRVAFAAQWAFAAWAVVASVIIPESPLHLLKKAKIEQARKSYARLYHADTAEAGLQTLQATLEQESSFEEVFDATTYWDCFKGINWRRTRIILYANLLQQCLGVSVLSNSSYFLELGGLSSSNSVMITQVGIALGLPANIISWFALTMLGRRVILMASSVGVGLLWLSIGIAGCFSTPGAMW
jgi:SP family general alpha glucoside:H+ symporter-like MFS transporter